jgi:hypothetical protein
MPSSVDTLVNQTVSRAEAAGDTLNPELVEIVRKSYKTGALGRVLEKAQTLAASIPGEQAVTYSGTFEDNVKARSLAQAYVQAKPGTYAIDNTEVGKHLSETPNWSAAMREVNAQLRERDLPPLSATQTFYVQEPAWRAASERFAEQAKGPMVSLINFPAANSAFVQNELPVSLNNRHVPSINDIPMADLAKSSNPVRQISLGAQPIFHDYTEFNTNAGRVVVNREPGGMSLVKPFERRERATLGDPARTNEVAVDVLRQVLKSKGLSDQAIERASEEARRLMAERERNGQSAAKVKLHDKAAAALTRTIAPSEPQPGKQRSDKDR